MTTLPGIAGQIEQAIGLELAERLLRRRGGTEFSIPKRAGGSMLAEIIGVRAAEDLIRHIGPGRIKLPCGYMRGVRARKAEAKRMLRDGLSVNQVALACDMHSRTVQNYRTEIDAERPDQQLKLPL